MGNRLTKIYTRTGDNGTTSGSDGVRILKNCQEVEALGAIDELNSHIGSLLSAITRDPYYSYIIDIQHDLFDIGGELSMSPLVPAISEKHVVRLEKQIDEMNTMLGPLKEFILPWGAVHIARTVCRRAERVLVQASLEQVVINPFTLAYINRLSDWLFNLARMKNLLEGRREIFWQQRKNA